MCIAVLYRTVSEHLLTTPATCTLQDLNAAKGRETEGYTVEKLIAITKFTSADPQIKHTTVQNTRVF